MQESLAEAEQNHLTYIMAILRLWAWLTKTSVAKKIQKFPFANSTKSDIDPIVTTRRLKQKMVAMEIKPAEKLVIEKKCCVMTSCEENDPCRTVSDPFMLKTCFFHIGRRRGRAMVRLYTVP